MLGQSIHCKKVQYEPGTDYALLYPHPSWEQFDQRTHEWRLAILGVGNDCQLCLVPSTTKKGDLVVAVAPTIPVMVIGSKCHDATVVTLDGLIPRDGPYENITEKPHGSCKLDRNVLEKLYWLFSGTLVLAIMVFCLVLLRVEHKNLESSAIAVIAAFQGATIAILLLARIITSNLLGFAVIEGEITFLKTVIVLATNLAHVIPALVTSTKKRRLFFVYSGIITAVLAANALWRTQRRINCSLEIALRRREVFGVLDTVAETLGRDYEFRGPVAGFEYTRRGLDCGRSTML
jgi:hypothetical protein